jgi:murein DD-endopeptidase MepM/ murein hydrolase activator NlpD
MLKRLARTCAKYFALFLFVFIYQVVPVAAQNTDVKPLQWPFYDPNATATTAPTGKVYMIGDSIAEGATTELTSALKSKGFSDVAINAKASRSLTEGGGALNGISILSGDKSQWADAKAVIIELGTNGGISTANIGKTVSIIHSPDGNMNAKIYWVNIGVDNSKRSGAPIDATTINKTLQDNSGSDYSVIDWAAQVKQHPDYIDPNPATGLGVHPTAAGKTAFASTVADGAVATSTSTAATAGSCCSSAGPASSVSGSISPEVGKGMTSSAQTKFQQILVAAAQKFGMDPNFLAAFYFEENNTGQVDQLKSGTAKWREPAPPYGKGDPWPSPHNGNVTGPFQIQTGNIPTYGDDGSGDGHIDLNDLADAAFTAAKYEAVGYGAKSGVSDAKLREAAFGYNHATFYVDAILDIYHFLSGGGQSPVSGSAAGCSGSTADSANAGGLVWPFTTKDSALYNRVDQGWDIQDKDPGALVYAIADGTLHVYTPDPGGFGNDYPVEKLDKSIGGPTDWVYYGHVHILSGLNGQHVSAGQLIAHTNKTDPENGSAAPPGWLELGFAQAGTDAPVAHCTSSATSNCLPTPAGQKMKSIIINAKPRTGN